MLNFLEMRKAFKAGGERGNKISLSPLQPADRTDVQSEEEARLLGLPAWESYATPKLIHLVYKKPTQRQEGWLSSRKWNRTQP